MVSVVKMCQTCRLCPSQWDGLTEDNRRVYVRYRWGHLTVEVGQLGDMDEFAALGKDGCLVFESCLGGPYDGKLAYSQLKELCRGVVSFPEEDDWEGFWGSGEV